MVLLQLRLVTSAECEGDGCGREFTHTHAPSCCCTHSLFVHALYIARLARSVATFERRCLDIQHTYITTNESMPSVVFFVPFCSCSDCVFSMILLHLLLVTSDKCEGEGCAAKCNGKWCGRESKHTHTHTHTHTVPRSTPLLQAPIVCANPLHCASCSFERRGLHAPVCMSKTIPQAHCHQCHRWCSSFLSAHVLTICSRWCCCNCTW